MTTRQYFIIILTAVILIAGGFLSFSAVTKLNDREDKFPKPRTKITDYTDVTIKEELELLASVWINRLKIDFPVYIIFEPNQENLHKWYVPQDSIVLGDAILIVGDKGVEYGIVRLYDMTEETLVHELIHLSNEDLTEEETRFLTKVKLETKYE